MSTMNFTIDDFDSPITYLPSQASWTTNDPSNTATFDDYADYYENTYHSTTDTSSAFNLTFTGTSVFIYGLAGPNQGSFSVTLDGTASNDTAYATEESTRQLLFAASNLTASSHSLLVNNLGSTSDGEGQAFTLDYITVEVEVGAPGATVTNTTVEDTDARLMYEGAWGNNSDTRFSGGTTSYTNGDGASVSLRFNGSAIAVYGDKSNDHEYFTVTLDGQNTTLNAVAGCGGDFGKLCEKTLPGLQFYQSYLNSSEHYITVTNLAGVNQSFFDLDRFVVYEPSVYLSTATTTDASVAAADSAASTLAPTLWPLLFLLTLFRLGRRSV